MLDFADHCIAKTDSGLRCGAPTTMLFRTRLGLCPSHEQEALGDGARWTTIEEYIIERAVDDAAHELEWLEAPDGAEEADHPDHEEQEELY